MVFIKFHNMNRKKKISNVAFKLKKFFTLQQVKTMLQSQFKNVQFSFLLFFNLCTDVLSILLKMSVLSFFFFFFICCVQQCSSFFSFFFFFPSFFPLSCTFLFFFSFFFFHNKLLIQCPFFFFFFQPYIYLSVFTLTQ